MLRLAVFALRYVALLFGTALVVCGVVLWRRDVFIFDRYFAPPVFGLILCAIGAVLLLVGFSWIPLESKFCRQPLAAGLVIGLAVGEVFELPAPIQLLDEAPRLPPVGLHLDE